MLNERDQRVWADIERRLGAEADARFLTFQVGPRRPATRLPWLPYVMAVVVPLLLPAISAAEMHPVVGSVAGLLVVVTLCRWAHRGASGTAPPPPGTSSLERSER
jgi:Protein of unknown function (DUF3040)